MEKTRRILIPAALVMSLFGIRGLAALRQTSVDPLQTTVNAIEDSSSYFVYRYTVVNPSTSTGGVTAFDLDIATPYAWQTIDPSPSGKVLFMSTGSEARVPVGPIVPPGWKATVLTRVRVADTLAAVFGNDSISPGSTLTGFGLRSIALPGIRTVHSYPTAESCCTTPLPGTCDAAGDESCQYPLPTAFPTFGVGVGPTFPPALFTVDTLASQRQATCASLQWILDPGICSILAERLDSAQSRLSAADTAAARAALTAFVTELDARHDSTQTLPVSHNAFWMLKTNALFLRDELLPVTCGQVTSYPFLAQVGVYNAGVVEIWNDTTTLHVKYNMANGWVLNETHLAVDLDLAGIPLNGAGGPAAEEFEYESDLAQASEYTHSIAFSSLGASAGTGLYIAANGLVHKDPPGPRQAWADGTRWLPTGDHWGMHLLYIVSDCQ